MTAMDLMNCIGQVKGAYILEAKNMAVPKRKTARRGVRRSLLIAAIIALLLLLVGCTVVYVLRLQDLKVGEYRYQTTPVYDENGRVIPAPTHPLRTEISLQGANQEALIQWNEFAKKYEQEPWDESVPEEYHYSYGCRSWEMVQKLDEILKQYNLSMLSREVDCQTYEAGKVLFESLGIGGLVREDALAALEYLDGWFYPEGTFTQHLLFTLDSEQWPYQDNLARYHYSQKAYFEAGSALITDFENCAQWNYTLKDGQTVLLAMNEEEAWIFADRPDAFVTVSFASSKWVGKTRVQMPREVLEQIAESFDYSIQPHPADPALVPTLQAKAKSDYEAQRAASRQALYSEGYVSYVQKRLDSTPMRDGLWYSLYDLNGDGVQELLAGGKSMVTEILSQKGGESYRYFSTDSLCAFPCFTICQENVLALKDYFSETWYYLRAREEDMTFLEGIRQQEGKWYHLTEPPVVQGQRRVENWAEVTEEQARTIQQFYVPLEMQPERQQMKKYGEPVKVFHFTDPYALYIAECLECREDAAQFTYALLDVNGDGIKELITKDRWTVPAGSSEPEYQLGIHTIVDGKRVTVNESYSMSGVCEDGIFMVYEKDGTYYAFYKMVGTELVMIEKVWQDYIDLYWSRDPDGIGPEAPRPITQEEAQSAISAYKPIELDMKPFSEYPFS